MSNATIATMNIPIADIDIDDNFNCRGKLLPIDVEELAKDIQANGQHQPVVVMPYNESEKLIKGKSYKLLAGFRRTYAHIILKLPTVLAVVKNHMSDIEARLLNLSENLKREDLNILQEAKALEALMYAGVPREEVARRVGKSGGWVQARWALLTLPKDIQDVAAAGLLNQYQLKRLAGIRKPEELYATVKQIKTRLANAQSLNIIQRKPPKKHEKKKRTTTEIANMRNYILDNIGSNPYSRALAWAAGGTSDKELEDAIRETHPAFVIPEPKEVELTHE
jgi:ParB family chromosome partitioning protein